MDAAPQTSSHEDVNEDGQDASTLTAQHLNYERWSKLPKTRGRQPRDPNAQTVRFQCRNIDDLERDLREYLEAPSSPAENTTLEFHYPVSSAFMVYAADFRSREENRAQGKQNEHLYGKLDRCAVSVIDALAQTEDAKQQMRRQKAIAKVCVEACEKADGFRYSFHNHWLSREDEACRFSYFCNDSTLNKGRAANEGAGTTGKRMRKPVYDCQGLIAVKFSHTKQSLEKRLRGRGTDSEEAIQKRLAQAKNEIEYCKTEGKHDKVIINDDLDRAYKELDEWVMKDLSAST